MKTTYGLRLEDLNTCSDFKKNSACEIKEMHHSREVLKIRVDH